MDCGVVNKAYKKESEEFSQNVMQQVNRPVENVMYAAVSTRQYVNCGKEGNLERRNHENRSLNLTVNVREVKRGKFSPKNDMDENKMQCQSARLLYTADSNSSENKTDSQHSSDQKVSFQVDENGKISDSTFIEHNDEIAQFSSRNLNNVKRIYVRGIAEINHLIEKGQIRHEAMKGLLKDTKFAFLKPSFISTYKDPLQKPHPYLMKNEYVPTLTSPAYTVHEDIVLSVPPTNTLIRETVTSPTDSQQATPIRTVSETIALANFDFTTTKDALNKCLNTGTVITVAGTAGSTKSTNSLPICTNIFPYVQWLKNVQNYFRFPAENKRVCESRWYNRVGEGGAIPQPGQFHTLINKPASAVKESQLEGFVKYGSECTSKGVDVIYRAYGCEMYRRFEPLMSKQAIHTMPAVNPPRTRDIVRVRRVPTLVLLRKSKVVSQLVSLLSEIKQTEGTAVR